MFREKRQQLQDHLAKRPRLKRLARVAPFFAVGPISGPLLAGVVLNFKDGRPVLGSLYAVLLAQYVILLPALVAKIGVHII